MRTVLLVIVVATSLASLTGARAETISASFTAPYTRGEACFDSASRGLYCITNPSRLNASLNQDVALLAVHGHLLVDQIQLYSEGPGSEVKGVGAWGSDDELYETSLDKYIGVATANGVIDVTADVTGHYVSREWSTGFHICLQVLEEYLSVAGQDCILDGEAVRNLSIQDAPITAGKKYWLFVVMKDLKDASEGYIRVARMSYTITI